MPWILKLSFVPQYADCLISPLFLVENTLLISG